MKRRIPFFIAVFCATVTPGCALPATGNFGIMDAKGDHIILGSTWTSGNNIQLGPVETEKTFKQGGEDFNWNDFSVDSYRNNSFSVTYLNSTREVIRLTTDLSKNRGLSTFMGVTSGDLHETVLTKARMIGALRLIDSGDSVLFELTAPDGQKINVGCWFDDQNRITWFDMYYDHPS